MAKKKDLTSVYFEISVKEIHIFVVTATQMDLQYHVQTPEKYQKYTQACIFVNSLRDIYYFGYNFASQTVKQRVIYKIIPPLR